MSAAQGGVLALDLSSCVGWAFGHVHAVAPTFGVWQLPYIGGEGARYVAFENELAEFMEVMRPSWIVLEAALSLQALASVSTIRVVRQQLTLRGIAYAEAYRASVPISEIDSYSVRLAMLGTGRFAKETVKREVVGYCRRQGWMVPDHNAGDACLVWGWHVGKIRGDRPASGPLFQERRVH